MPTGAGPPWETVIHGRSDDSPRLAVRGRDGTGVPLVLLHGLGGNLEEWESVAGLLAPDYPVYAFDQRGHGRSGDGSCTAEGLLADLARVVTRFDLRAPVVVGHETGGFVAALFAARHVRGVTAVVSVDGYGWPCAREMAERLGLGAAEAAANVAAARAYLAEQMAADRAPMPIAVFDRLLASYRRGAFGLPGTLLEAVSLRSTVRSDQLVSPRPGPHALRTLCADLDTYDYGSVVSALRVPALSLVALRPHDRMPGAPARLNEILAARAASELAAGARHRTSRGLDTRRPAHLTRPAAVAEAIEEFLAGLAG